MQNIKLTLKGIAILVLSVLMLACATVPAQVPVQVPNAVFAKQGDPVYLFHGGSKPAREEFCVNSVVPVYRFDGRYSSGSTGLVRNQVGKIRITKDLGEYYSEGVVVDGTIKKGDVAVQPQSGCLISLSEPSQN